MATSEMATAASAAPLTACTSTLCHTTSATPSSPAATPAHCRGCSRWPRKRCATSAVASGCVASSSAVMPADRPSTCAWWLPPRFTACISSPATPMCSHSARVAGQRGRVISTQGSRHSAARQKRSVRKVKGDAYCSPVLLAR
ncbi:hypothetical protein LRS14_26820 [Aquincola sp. J276]|nr:hypothetical protein [Aquincola sp. J276]MCR5868721.1 hypothetical protein [Aquincola sp. J276]